MNEGRSVKALVNHHEREGTDGFEEQEIFSVMRIQSGRPTIARSPPRGSRCPGWNFGLQVGTASQDLRQDDSSPFPLTVGRRHQSTDSLKRSEQGLNALAACRHPSASQQFLRYHRTEENTRRIPFINFAKNWKCCSALDQVNIQIGIDKVSGHQKIFSTPPLPATFSNDFRISPRKTIRFRAASIASVSVRTPNIARTRRIFLSSR
jgi:hypothetical protein